MKYLFIATLLFVACNSQKKNKMAPVSQFVTIMYAHNWDKNDYRVVTSKRVILDTAQIDSVSDKIVWKRDTVYAIVFVDTARDASNNPRLDSTGKKYLEAFWAILPKQLIVKDFDKVWPQTLPKMQDTAKRDTTQSSIKK